MKIALIKAFVHIELCHSGKVIAVQRKTVVVILQIVTVIFPIDVSFVSCQTPVRVTFQWTFTQLTFPDIVVDPDFLGRTRRLPWIAAAAQRGLRKLVRRPGLRAEHGVQWQTVVRIKYLSYQIVGSGMRRGLAGLSVQPRFVRPPTGPQVVVGAAIKDNNLVLPRS